MILLPTLATSLIHFSSKSWENVLFELGSERVNPMFIMVMPLVYVFKETFIGK